ncbi:alpha/beta hydrolase [Candidatus Bathyarchaeota archaeon]|nr:alpha/beta hydrolase [Candidatus Bathyarchaeota archaeon]
MSNKPIEGYVLSHGRHIQYVMWGSKGPAIVLIHSMGMDCHSMDALCESLQSKYRILSLTILGHGESDIPDTPVTLPEHSEIMRECYKELGYYPNILIGHSIGGMMGMILAAEHLEEFKGLVLVDIAPFDPVTPRPGTRTPIRTPPPSSFKDDAEARTWLKERYPGFTEYYIENRLKHAFLKEGKTLKLKPTGDSIRAGMNIDLWPYVNRIKIPTLLLKGGTGSIISPETVEKMEKSIPKLETVTIQGTGHMIPQDKPQEFEEEIKKFLKKLNY